MNTNIQVFDLEQNADLWKTKLTNLDIDDVYFQPEYLVSFSSVSSGKGKLFVYTEGDMTCIYPFRLRAIDKYQDITSEYGYSGPMVASSSQISQNEKFDFLARMRKAFDGYCLEEKIIAEFVRFHPLFENWQGLENFMQVVPLNKTVIVDLTQSAESLWQSFRKGHRYDLKKSIKLSIQVSSVKDIKDMVTFQEIYEETMTEIGAQKFYFFEKDFFKKMFEVLHENIIVMFAQTVSGEVLAVSMFLVSKNYAHYHFSGRRTGLPDQGAVKLLLFNAMELAKARGVKKMHLGGGYGGSDQDSLMDFKAGFSKERGQFAIGKKIHQPAIYEILCKERGVDPYLTPFFPAYRYGER